MRIGVFVDMYLPHVSGVTNHIALYKRRWEDLGHEVFVFTFGDTDYRRGDPSVVRTAGLQWRRTGWRFSPRFSSKTRTLIPTLDIAHVHHPFQSGPLVRPFCREYGIPLVFTNHTRYDLYSDEYARFVPEKVRHAFVKRQLGSFTRACDLVIAPSASIAQWLGEYCDFADAVVIPNGIDVERFASPRNPVSRQELGFTDDDVIFCYAGRLGPEKNTKWLAREFVTTHREEPRARLLIIGDGPSRENAEKIIADAGATDAVRFLGMRPYETLPDLEAAADVFVTGSVSEVHPLVVLEAMAAGLPIAAVHSPGISDTVEDGVSGLLAPAPTDGALAERMIALAGDAGLRERLSSGAREAAQRYGFEQTADVVLGKFEGLVSARRKR